MFKCSADPLQSAANVIFYGHKAMKIAESSGVVHYSTLKYVSQLPDVHKGASH